MKVAKILEIPSIRILLFIQDNNEVRHSDISRMIGSRGTVSYSLKELEEEGLLQRRIVPTKPIQSNYSLTSKGIEVAKRFKEIALEIESP